MNIYFLKLFTKRKLAFMNPLARKEYHNEAYSISDVIFFTLFAQLILSITLNKNTFFY